MISVVMPVLDQINWTDDCLRSLKENTIQPSEVILIDNGSKDDYRSLVEKYRPIFNMKYVRNEENIGVNPSWNLGLKLSTSPYILFLNNDTYLNRFFIKKVLKVMEDETVGICIPIREVTLPRVEMVNKDDDPITIIAPDIEGWAFAIRREVCDKTGPIPDILRTFMGDTFFFDLSVGLGYKNIKITNNTVYHYGSLTVKVVTPDQTQTRLIHKAENYEWRKMREGLLKKIKQ